MAKLTPPQQPTPPTPPPEPTLPPEPPPAVPVAGTKVAPREAPALLALENIGAAAAGDGPHGGTATKEHAPLPPD